MSDAVEKPIAERAKEVFEQKIGTQAQLKFDAANGNFTITSDISFLSNADELKKLGFTDEQISKFDAQELKTKHWKLSADDAMQLQWRRSVHHPAITTQIEASFQESDLHRQGDKVVISGVGPTATPEAVLGFSKEKSEAAVSDEFVITVTPQQMQQALEALSKPAPAPVASGHAARVVQSAPARTVNPMEKVKDGITRTGVSVTNFHVEGEGPDRVYQFETAGLSFSALVDAEKSRLNEIEKAKTRDSKLTFVEEEYKKIDGSMGDKKALAALGTRYNYQIPKGIKDDALKSGLKQAAHDFVKNNISTAAKEAVRRMDGEARTTANNAEIVSRLGFEGVRTNFTGYNQWEVPETLLETMDMKKLRANGSIVPPLDKWVASESGQRALKGYLKLPDDASITKNGFTYSVTHVPQGHEPAAAFPAHADQVRVSPTIKVDVLPQSAHVKYGVIEQQGQGTGAAQGAA
jgi:hypothetical protein